MLISSPPATLPVADRGGKGLCGYEVNSAAAYRLISAAVGQTIRTGRKTLISSTLSTP